MNALVPGANSAVVVNILNPATVEHQQPLDPERIAQAVCISCTDDKHPDVRTLHYFRNEFYLYEGGVYRALDIEAVRQRVFFAATALAKDFAAQTGRPKAHVTMQVVSNVLNALRAHVLVEGEMPQWLGPVDSGDKPPRYINCVDGLLDADVDTEDLKRHDHTPLWFSVVQLPFPGAPQTHYFDEDEQAMMPIEALGANPNEAVLHQCPNWLEFLDMVFDGDQERIDLLQEWAGYLLSEENDAQKLMLLHGDGGTGKSTVLDVLAALVGESNVSHINIVNLFERFATCETIGKLLNVSNEFEKGEIQEAALKNYVDGALVSADRKKLPHIHFKPTAKLVLASNTFPAFTDTSNGVWRRVLLLPFNVVIKDRGPVVVNFFKERLLGELSGIFHWALQGRDRLRAHRNVAVAAQGVNFPFTDSAVASDALAEQRGNADPVRQFLSDYTTGDGKVLCSDLREALERFCEGMQAKELSELTASLTRRVKERFPSVKDKPKYHMVAGKGTTARFYVGLVKKADLTDLT